MMRRPDVTVTLVGYFVTSVRMKYYQQRLFFAQIFFEVNCTELINLLISTSVLHFCSHTHTNLLKSFKHNHAPVGHRKIARYRRTSVVCSTHLSAKPAQRARMADYESWFVWSSGSASVFTQINYNTNIMETTILFSHYTQNRCQTSKY